ncbi:MAG: Uma2 family endonuclease [Rhodopirellula sp.]|nr:Uma2 family endonuclease [Rhodopirellula sp.]
MANRWPLVVNLGPVGKCATEEEFFEFCQLNRDLHIERTSKGEIFVMPPSGGESGRWELGVGASLFQWAERDGTGVAFSSSTGFLLPNGAERSPDLAWVRRDRWEALTQDQRERFPPLCPDFVVEIRSRTDRLPPLQEKMREYIANGAQLGWLIDPAKAMVYVYRPGAPVERLDNPDSISGDPILPGFILNLRRLIS